LFLIFFVGCVLVLAAITLPAHAQTDSAAERSIELAPALDDGREERRAVGVFFRRVCRIETRGGPVRLTAAERGEALRTDDAVRVLVERPDGRIAEWRHDFRDRVVGAIAALDSHRLDELFASGLHTVTLTLIDLRPPRHSSSAYVLKYAAAPEAVAECFDPATAAAAAVFEPTVVAHRNHVQSCAAYEEHGASVRSAGVHCAENVAASFPNPDSDMPVHEPALRSDASPAAAVVYGAVEKRVATTSTATPSAREQMAIVQVVPGMAPEDVAWKVGVPIVFVLLAAGGLLKRRRVGLTLSGLLTVQDRSSGERIDHIDLVHYGRRIWICSGPLQVKSGDAEPRGAAGRIDVDDMNGCLLTARTGAMCVLRDGDVVTLGDRLRVTYRAPSAFAPISVEAMS
jgi:hypothetical protein